MNQNNNAVLPPMLKKKIPMSHMASLNHEQKKKMIGDFKWLAYRIAMSNQ